MNTPLSQKLEKKIGPRDTRGRRVSSIVVSLLFLLTTSLVYGQGGASGTILGTITDTSGAVVDKAAIEIRNVENGTTQRAETTDSGAFSVPYLHPGIYRVSVKKTGFQTSQTDNVTLAVDQHARIDITLKPGQVSEVVNVSTSAVALDTDTAEISQTISSRQVTDLPLNSRNFVSLLFLSPGAVMTGGESGGNTIGGAKGNGAISINGGRSSSNQYLIDGMYNNDTIFQTPAISPSIDAIQEFKLQSGAYSAEYGGSANQVNISFRSGTNSFHGTAFEFLRNDAFDAHSFFDSSKIPALKQNQFGYTLGGPIWIPKIYNGRNRSFFFANYEGLRLHEQGTVHALLPTQAELGIGTPNGAALIPASAVDGPGCKNGSCALVNPSAGYSPFAQDGAGNYVIPASSFSNYANVVRSHVPLPNSTFTDASPFNYISKLAVPTIGNQQNYRFDQNIGSRNALFFRYSRAEFIVTGGGVGLLPEGQTNDVSQQTSYQGGYTRTFSSNLINQFRYGFLRSDDNEHGVSGKPADIAALKFQGLYPLKSTPFVETTWSGTNLSAFGGQANNDPRLFDQPTYDISDSVTIIHGNHTFSTGADYRKITLNDGGNANLGLITFDGQFSNSHIGDLILGDYQGAQGTSPTPFSTPGDAGTIVHIHHDFAAAYFQDDWKLNQRLTLNLGLRYDFNNVPYNQNNHYGWFNPTGPGFLVVADKTLIDKQIDGGIYKYAGGKTPFSAQKKVFAPRLGFAYRPVDKTVLRGGYGLYFDSSEDSETHQFAEFYPYSVRQNLTASKTLGKVLNADQLYPPISNIGPVTPDLLGFLLTQINNRKNPYVQEYNLSLEREVAASTKVELSFAGNRGTHLVGRQNLNQPFPYQPSSPSSVAARTPFSNFGPIILVDEWNNNSNYNAMNVKVETNSHGLNLLAAYTWSKSMDTKSAAAGVDGDSAGWASAQNPHNIKAEYARSGYDVGQRLVVSFVDDLPIGKGKMLDLRGPGNLILGSWQLNAIGTFQGGFPFSVNANDNSGLNGNVFAERANLVGPPELPRSQRNEHHWFNNKKTPDSLCLGNSLAGVAFCNPAIPNPAFNPGNPNSKENQYLQGGLYGNSSRNILRGPGLNNWDASLFRNVAIKEKLNVQLRIESFNSFNHRQMGGPDTNVNDDNFGTIQGVRVPGRIVQLGAKVIF